MGTKIIRDNQKERTGQVTRCCQMSSFLTGMLGGGGVVSGVKGTGNRVGGEKFLGCTMEKKIQVWKRRLNFSKADSSVFQYEILSSSPLLRCKITVDLANSALLTWPVVRTILYLKMQSQLLKTLHSDPV